MSVEYLLDTNILITAHRQVYPFDIAPSFWDQLLNKCSSYDVCFVDRVISEIIEYKDALTDWVKDNKDSFKIYTSDCPDVIMNYSKIITAAERNENFRESAKREFADVADSWLIAHALTHNSVIVTQEKYIQDIKARIPIPNVCREFEVKYINLIEFMRETQMKFT